MKLEDNNSHRTGMVHHLMEDTGSALSVSWLGYVADSPSGNVLYILVSQVGVRLEHSFDRIFVANRLDDPYFGVFWYPNVPSGSAFEILSLP